MMVTRVVCAGLLVGGLVSALPVPAADALVTTANGRTGGVSVAKPGHCKHDTRGNVTASSGPITVTAPRGTSANVRISTQNVTNGVLVSHAPWSRFQRVSPGRPTSFAGGSAAGNWRSSVSLAYAVEFHHLRGGVMGTRVVQLTRYNFFNPYNVGPTGPISVCRGH